MSDCTVIAGRCTTSFEGTRDKTQHGDVVVLIKPDNTVLVHDAGGYQPVAWLTRPESVTVSDGRVQASDGDQFLEVDVHDTHVRGNYPTSDAGIPVGECPDCGATLARSGGSVSCFSCGSYSLPRNATVLEESCGDCGLPRIRVERGVSFVVCLDRACEPLDERVRAAFDREWSCPDCGDDLRVLRRGGLILGCDSYPECETGFRFPDGVHDGVCGCGLPTFETPAGCRCLDDSCTHARTTETG